MITIESMFPRRAMPLYGAILLASLIGLLAVPAVAQDAPLVLLVQPTASEETMRRAFRPLADYLGRTTGAKFVVASAPNLLAHWTMVRRNRNYDLVLDDAHFTDYRVQKFGFQLLARVAGTTSYSLAVARDARLRAPLELAGKKVASFGPPGMGATRLNAMFPNPARRPAIIEVLSATDGLRLLSQGNVAGVMLPTAALADSLGRGDIRVITTAEPTPNMALSISSRVNARLRAEIRTALLKLDDAILQGTGIERFESAGPDDYAGYGRLLRDTWGY